MEESRLTPEAICSGLRVIQAGYERQGEDFDIVFKEGEYGKWQHRIEVSFCRLLSEAVDLLNDQQHQICELQEVNEHLRDSRHLDERHLKLLIFALRIGWQVIDHSRNYFEYCDDARNDYFLMTEKLSEIIGENLDETRD